jgi:DNA-binding winged helix-turn-helix (wHTH) protein
MTTPDAGRHHRDHLDPMIGLSQTGRPTWRHCREHMQNSYSTAIRTPLSSEYTIAFGAFRLLLPQRLLLKDHERVRLGSRAMETLVVLLERPGALIPKRYLMQRIWPDMLVEEGTLRVHVAALRKALGDSHSGIRYIENITGHGYRFVAPVTRD